MTGSRNPYADVGEATRRAIAAATHADPPLRPREWRVFNSILWFTATWSKLEDGVTHEQIADVSSVHMSHVREELRSLRSRGLITYTPGGRGRPEGKGQPSTVGLVTLSGGADTGGASLGPPKVVPGGPASDGRGGQTGALGGAGAGPPPEVSELPERNGGASRSQPEPRRLPTLDEIAANAERAEQIREELDRTKEQERAELDDAISTVTEAFPGAEIVGEVERGA